MASTHGWERLDEVGKYVLVPDKKPRQVSSAAKIFINRKYGPEAVVASVDTPAGAFVVLAYLPPSAPAVPEPTSVAPRTEDQAPRRTEWQAAQMAANPSVNNKDPEEEKKRKRAEATRRLEEEREAEAAAERAANSHPDPDENDGYAVLDMGDDDE